MRVEVTQADIDAGEPHACDRCPVALAVLRAMRDDADEVAVAANIISCYRDNVEITFSMPRTVRVFVKAFDDGEPVSPFAFDLPVLVVR
jgi:hypothetical protein